MPRIHCPEPLAADLALSLPAAAARHVQVLRMQPGQAVTLFDGQGGQWQATITRMGRSDVAVRVDLHQALEREAPRAVRLALGMPANERMDWLVEKATELGAAGFSPLVCERSVLRLAGERAERKQAHWQAVAVAACEQSGRNRVPGVGKPMALADWLAKWRVSGLGSQPRGDEAAGAMAAAIDSPGHGATAAVPRRLLLSLDPAARPLRELASADPAALSAVLLLSGPEGGLSPREEQLARDAGFEPVTLGPRVLRAETAPLAALALLAH